MLPWREILHCLENFLYQIVKEDNREQEFCEMQAAIKGLGEFFPNCLYFVQESGLTDLKPEKEISVIYLGDSRNLSEDFLGRIANCVCLQREEEFLDAFRKISGLFGIQHQIGAGLFALQEAVKENRGIQNIVDLIADILKMPVSIMDNTFRFIARSRNYIAETTMFDMTVMGDDEALTATILERLKERGMLKRVIEAEDVTHVVYDEDSAYFIPVTINHLKVGYMTVYEAPGQRYALLPRTYVRYLSLIATFASFEMAKNNFYIYNKGRYFTYILSLILEHEKVDIDDIRMRLRVYNHELRDYMYLLSIEMDQENGSDMGRTAVADFLRNMFRNSIYMNRDGALLFLISRNKNDLVTEAEVESWNAYLLTEHLRAGFTGPFTDFSDMKQKVRNVQMTVRACGDRQDGRCLFRFEDYQIDTLLFAVKEKVKLNEFCYRPLIEMMEYDREHHTELTETLREYLGHPKDIGAICQKLCIHKNTLYKRLEKIRGFLGPEWSDAETIMKIQITFHILVCSSTLWDGITIG